MPKEKILIADDESDVLTLCVRIIRSAGYDVTGVTNGLKAIEAAQEQHFDLFLTDIMMPGIDGFETLKRIREVGEIKDIPIVIFSCGSEEEEWARRALSLGSVGYVVKPFDSEALLFTVEKFIRKGKADDEKTD